jgi:signal transduction histidine kinase
MRVPKALFDSVADNLLQNAIAKRAAGAEVRIRASLQCRNGPELRVHDSGGAVPADIVGGLLRGPVSSRVGLGIGLYQAARLAESGGYRLELETNRDGEVCFLLIQGNTPAATMRP